MCADLVELVLALAKLSSIQGLLMIKITKTISLG